MCDALQPAALAGEARGLDAVADAELGDGLGEVVPDRALGQVQAPGDLGARQPFFRRAQHLALAIGQRVGLAPRVLRQLRIDDAQALVDAADRVRQFFGGRVLEQVARRAGVERPPQVARARERGQDDDARASALARRGAARPPSRGRSSAASRCRSAPRPDRSRAASASASRPSRALATTSMSGSISSSAASAPSTMPWSSAIRHVECHIGSLISRRVPWSVSRRRHAAERLDALAHAGQAVAERRVAAAPVVFHFHQHRAVLRVETDVAPRRAGVPDDVGRRLPQRQRQRGFLRRRERHRPRSMVASMPAATRCRARVRSRRASPDDR